MSKNVLATVGLLVLSSCLFANQISKKPYQAKNNSPAPAKALIELKSDKAALAQEPVLAPAHANGTAKKEAVKIAPPQTIEQNLLGNQTSSLPANNHISDNFKQDQNFKKPTHLLNPELDLEATDIGFITLHPTYSKGVEMYVGALNEVDQQRYTLAFDDNKLIYFDIQKILEPASQRNSQTNAGLARKAARLSKQGKVLLSNSFKNTIIRNTSNNGGIIEANHISVKDNRIILDVKELRVNQLPERKNYLNTAIKAIEQRSTVQASENLLHTIWKARKAKINGQP